MSLRLSIITNGRSDEGIYLPLLKALDKTDIDYTFKTIHDTPFPHFDWLVVLGDTMPMLLATLAAASNNIPVAHIHGGDRTGSIDDSIRHAISKFAHLHFPSLPEHADRLIKMGEEPWRIKTCGPLGIYAMPDAEYISKDKLQQDLGLDDKPIILVIQHPVSTEWQEAGNQMKETLDAVNNPDWQPVVIYPNSEQGSADMIKVIESYPYKHFKNLPYLQFLSLLKASSCIVGNSSCGLVEAPLFGVPCVNVGSRQKGRNQSLNVINTIYEQGVIKMAIKHNLSYFPPDFNPYLGYANGPEIIIKTLKETPIDKRLLEKRVSY